MKKTDLSKPATPTVQVIERMFTLLDILASREETLSLKEISEKSGLHPLSSDLSPAATGWACACWSWAIWSRRA